MPGDVHSDLVSDIINCYVTPWSPATWKAPPTALLEKLPVLLSWESAVRVSEPQHTGLPPGAMGMERPCGHMSKYIYIDLDISR